MILKILLYIRGYLRIRITGYSAERFLNACSHRGIRLWNLRPVDNSYEMNITIQGFKQIKQVAKKTGTKVVIIRRVGLPFFLHRYRKRKLFFAGIAVCILLLAGLSRFIWNIDIRGNLTRTDETLLSFLETQNVKNGMKISDVDCERIVKDIRKEYNDIIWVSASIEGTRLIIQVKENEDSIPVNEEEASGEATDIVADKDCVITSIITRKGVPQVQEGTSVQAGDILVSGQVPVNNDAKETVAYRQQKSDADIRGQTTITYEDVQPLIYYEKEGTYQYDMHEYYIIIGGYRLSIGRITNKNYKNFELISHEKQVMILDNLYLPVTLGTRTASPYNPIKKSYTKDEIQKALSARFLRYCEDLNKKGVEIIQNDVKIYTGSEEAQARGTLTVIMPVGEEQPSQIIEIPEQTEENQQSGDIADGNNGSGN